MGIYDVRVMCVCVCLWYTCSLDWAYDAYTGCMHVVRMCGTLFRCCPLHGAYGCLGAQYGKRIDMLRITHMS